MDLLNSTPPGEQNQRQEQGSRKVVISGGPVLLEGLLSGQAGARGIIVFAYDQMAEQENLQGGLATLAQMGLQAGFAVLTINLLTPEDEELNRSTGFFRKNVEVLHQRVIGIANWLIDNSPGYQGISIGYLGAGVSGAALLAAAAARPDAAHAIVAIATRTDLVQSDLPRVVTPTLLIAGEDDQAAADLSRKALDALTTDRTLDLVTEPPGRGVAKRLVLLRGVSNIFDNQQALQTVGQQATDWFTKYLI